MATADDPTNTTDWILLRKALALAVEALGSVALAKAQLTEWMAAGKLPWRCLKYKPGKYHPGSVLAAQLASIASGDPRFWRLLLKIDWEDNCARENAPRGGAQALGIRVSKMHLLAQLPEKPRERVETPGQAEAAEREKLGPKEWLAWARKIYPQKRNERPTPYIHRLHGLMEKAVNVTEVWTFGNFRRRFYEETDR